MKATEDDLLSLDDELNSLLPFTVDNPLVADETIELRHLVTHTSGIQDNWSNMPYSEGDPTVALGAYLEGYLVPGGAWYNATDNFYDYLPGEGSDYGNIATALAGYAVEVQSKTPFDDYCEQHVFDVLGMENTGWHLEDFDVSTLAMPYEYVGGDYASYGHYGYADYPDGQLRSSVSDMARFLAAVSNEGEIEEARVLSALTVDQMFTAPMPAVHEGQFVFWYESTVSGRAVIGHNGSDQGVATQMVFTPDTGIGVIVMMNVDWDSSVSDAAADIQTLLFERAEAL